MRKIIPYLQAGHPYAKKDVQGNDIGACGLAGYNHSGSETAEERANRVLKDKLELLPKNSLRNPVVEKILNQMINLVNQIIEEYGKPDEVRIELARELKQSAEDREKTTKEIAASTRKNQDIKNIIRNDFGIPSPTKTDVYRYRLWEELHSRGCKTIFTGQYIPKERLFGNDVQIEHIIPRDLMYDDSYSNMTLAYNFENIKKSNRTAYDYVSNENLLNIDHYVNNVKQWYNEGKGSISKAKMNKLLMSMKDLPGGFIERDLKNTQYIAREAMSMLKEVVRTVYSTTGKITDRLRAEWGLTNLMKELNMPKYKTLGLTEQEVRWDVGASKMKSVNDQVGAKETIIDIMLLTLTVAFTTHNHVQYSNYLMLEEIMNMRNMI